MTEANKLMIVAHPDDESLFGGGQLIVEGNWKVVCVTNGDHSVRRAEFERVMFITLSRSEIWQYYDEQFTPLKEKELDKDLNRVVHEQKWEKIVTHNEEGEYGHLHHKQIHKVMKKIVGPNLWTFNFDAPYPLSDSVWKKKVELVSVYKSQKKICDEILPKLNKERIIRGKLL